MNAFCANEKSKQYAFGVHSMTTINSFSPITSTHSRILILGSIPGKVSLDAYEYYAHPRNTFWKILAAHMHIDHATPYPNRCQTLRKHHIALWDVLHSCTRPGSLDADIVEDSIAPNDFNSLFSDHPSITHVFFNGAKAEHAYTKYVLPTLSPDHAHLHYQRLPSTSPAHAAMSYDEKLHLWSEALNPQR